MDFDLNEDQSMLSRTVADFCKKESTVERFRKSREAEESWDRSVWKQMGELGWLSVPFPESVGGFGGNFVDAGIILEQLGKTLVPEPYLSCVILGGYSLLLGGDDAQQKRFLTPMIEGESAVALAWAERGSRFDPARIQTTATKTGEGWHLVGEKVFVLDGHAADQLVVSARTGEDLGLFVVEGSAVTRQTLRLMDGRRGAHIKLDVTVDADRRLATEDAAGVLARVLDYGAAATVAESVGVAHSMLAMTTQYLKEREQFGVKIGSFQALQHRAVDMFVEVELLRSINIEAMVRADEDGIERERAISAAKFQLATGGQEVSRAAVQLHGGIGVTDEHDIGLFFKRMQVLTTVAGDEAHHTARYARLMDE
ncbi:MAG: acyl-CoA dehydrogenase [Myxococcota bacterium]